MKSVNGWKLIIIMIIGVLLGSILGEAFSTTFPLLSKGITAGLTSPLILDLKIITLTFGFTLKLNVASVIGMVLAFLLFKKVI